MRVLGYTIPSTVVEAFTAWVGEQPKTREEPITNAAAHAKIAELLGKSVPRTRMDEVATRLRERVFARVGLAHIKGTRGSWMAPAAKRPAKQRGAGARPRELTPEQRREFVGGVESEGFCYYFIDYTSPEYVEKRVGRLPRDVLAAWNAFRKAYDNLRDVLDLDREDEGDAE